MVNTDALFYYLDALRTGDEECAFFGLLDLGEDAVPVLIEQAAKRENRDIRATLANVICQWRQPSSVDFLGQAMTDDNPAVWKQALDGLVTIGGPAALAWLAKTRACLERGELHNGLTTEWLDDAAEQLDAAWRDRWLT